MPVSRLGTRQCDGANSLNGSERQPRRGRSPLMRSNRLVRLRKCPGWVFSCPVCDKHHAYGDATIQDKHLASTIHCIDDEFSEWLERRGLRRAPGRTRSRAPPGMRLSSPPKYPTTQPPKHSETDSHQPPFPPSP